MQKTIGACGLHTSAVTVFRDRYPGASDISSPPCLPRWPPARAVAGWALHPLKSAASRRRGERAFAQATASGRPIQELAFDVVGVCNPRVPYRAIDELQRGEIAAAVEFGSRESRLPTRGGRSWREFHQRPISPGQNLSHCERAELACAYALQALPASEIPAAG